MQAFTLPAPAKINWFLHIIGQRDDGYHELQTLFQFIDFCDELSFTVNKNKQLSLTSNVHHIANDHNLVIRAAKLLQQVTGKRYGVDINLTKHIPIGAGLGGGSSDAATTLLALNQLWQTNLTNTQLADIGAQLGADVPVFIYGQTAWADGIGTHLTALDIPETWIILVIPPVQVSTAEIFCNEALPRNTSRCKIAASLIDEGKNDCQELVSQLYPEVARALTWLNQHAPARMTGTGSCVFAPIATQQQGQDIIADIPEGYRGFVVKTLTQSPVITQL